PPAALVHRLDDHAYGALGPREAVSPFDGHGAGVQEPVEVEVVELGTRSQAVEVHVRERDRSRIDADELEGRAHDLSAHTHPPCQAAHDGGLSRASVTVHARLESWS